ncbi:MAG TPA: HRDC domain-containing protein [Gemmatimonadales bacterium]|nr:HRDC domain-containing protein [Gemmatimonadales bacterium]
MNAASPSDTRSQPPVRLIQSQGELESLFQRFSGEPLLAVDTEAASFHRFHDRIYLLQLSSRLETAVVDPLAVTSLEPLSSALADPAVEIVFHDADYDLRLLGLQYGFRATNLFDTRIAAQLLNEPGVGLAALLEKFLGVRLDKRFQRADWSARPLSAEMLEYAAADTHYLLALRDLLRERLREQGRLEWAEEEFALATTARRPSDPEEPGYLRLKGAKALPGRALAVLRELYDWRDQLARRTDKAAFRILNNEPLLSMAISPPTDLAQLKAIRGIGAEQAERRSREILAAVQRGLALPEAKLPRVERATRRPPDAAYEARLERLKAARNQLAAQYNLAPGILCPNGTLEAIARLNPTTLEQLAQIPELRRWQLSECGNAFLAALQRPAA